MNHNSRLLTKNLRTQNTSMAFSRHINSKDKQKSSLSPLLVIISVVAPLTLFSQKFTSHSDRDPND